MTWDLDEAARGLPDVSGFRKVLESEGFATLPVVEGVKEPVPGVSVEDQEPGVGEVLDQAKALVSASGSGTVLPLWRASRVQVGQIVPEVLDYGEWLRQVYLPTELLPCWALHPQVWAEVVALMWSYRAAWSAEDTGMGPVLWHEHLELARMRMVHRHGACTARDHAQPAGPRLPVHRQVKLADVEIWRGGWPLFESTPDQGRDVVSLSDWDEPQNHKTAKP
ncbi:hypothetical protein [Devriesea agamarum]|uniref:hypothetical protein n=1 Tax=Devriesea agamarum TaxID=472569 RepID=UPI00071E43A1|nr:hypothetical protein [Devriesea agamarum]